jgi:hypothetical protein
MISFKATGLPKGFPYPEAIAKVWVVVYFEPAGPKKTHVKLVGNGYTEEPESKKLLDFFQKGNDWTLGKLQNHFVPGSVKLGAPH